MDVPTMPTTIETAGRSKGILGTSDPSRAAFQSGWASSPENG
jgi:hypothetical protein